MDSFITALTESLKNVIPSDLIVFIISLLPILELRGGIIAAYLLNINWVRAYLVCVVGNLIPVPLILIFIRQILDWMKNTRFVKFTKRLEEKAERKSASVKKYKFLGLFILVAVPLPGTGAWTGALVAAFLNMRLKDAIVPIILGVMTAGIIVTLLTYGLIGNIF